MKSITWIVSLVVFLLVVCYFHKQLREGFVNTMNLTISQMVSDMGLTISPQTLPYGAICSKTSAGDNQCKPPYTCKTTNNNSYGNCS